MDHSRHVTLRVQISRALVEASDQEHAPLDLSQEFWAEITYECGICCRHHE
jgi:hypothetical protein